MKSKSIGINAGLNMIRTICRVIFPLITFPYISRVLHIDNIGIYNFCTSIISYFTLAAGLGIETYAVREGARYRNDRVKMDQFASEVFSINLVSTILSYIVLFLCILFLPRLRADASILIVLSISIIFTTIGCEWVFTVYEDFTYITLRSIAFQFLSLIMMFVFVRSEKDLLMYATITVISSTGSNVINAYTRRKYCKIRIVLNKNLLIRLSPILVLFATSIATTIYTNSDTTMLGIFAGNRATGLYSVSTKIYTLVKQLLAAIIIVSVPRLSAYLGERRIDLFKKNANQILNTLIVIVVPAMIGIFSLSKNIILIISGKEYIDATLSLQILAVALFFSIFGWFYTACILIPNREENKVLEATIIAALSNIFLNLILIPIFQQNGAAFTTVVAELLSMIICWRFSHKYFKARLSFRDVLGVTIGCLGIFTICFFCEKLIDSVLLSTIFAIGFSIILYGIVLILTKNKSISFIIDTIKRK